MLTIERAREIEGFLKDRWILVPQAHEYQGINFERGDAVFNVRLHEKDNKIVVMEDWADHLKPYSNRIPGSATDTIKANANRSAEAIASEIERRFLPGYYKALAVVQNRYAAGTAHDALTAQNAERLAKASNGKVTFSRNDNSTPTIDGGEVNLYMPTSDKPFYVRDARVNGDRVRLELGSLPIKIAEQIVTILYPTERK